MSAAVVVAVAAGVACKMDGGDDVDDPSSPVRCSFNTVA